MAFKFTIKARFTGVGLFTCELAAEYESASEPVKLGAAVKQAVSSKANLYGADLGGADLRGANLYGADLRGANLRGANLYGADLYGADLYGADLYGTILDGRFNREWLEQYAIALNLLTVGRDDPHDSLTS